jgi:hypothetical protein
MPFSFRRFLAVALTASGLANGRAAEELRLPPIAGELSGDFTLLLVAGAPKLHWTLALSAPSSVLRTAQLTVDGDATHARIDLELDASGNGRWRLRDGHARLKSWGGGQLTEGDASVQGEGTLRAGKFDGKLALELREVDLGELLRFADADKKYVQSAEGRISGRVDVTLKDGAPQRFEASLGLDGGTEGFVLFRPSPGLLTGVVPEAVQKYYPGLAAIELGQTPLQAKVLRLTTYPDGDPEGRTARIRIEGRPLDPRLIAPLELDINVSGPVEALLRKWRDLNLKVAGAKG